MIEMDTTKNEINIVDKNGVMDKEFLIGTMFLCLTLAIVSTIQELNKVGLLKRKLTTEEMNEIIQKMHIISEKKVEEIISKQKKVK